MLKASSSRRDVYSSARGSQVFCEVVKERERLWGCEMPWLIGSMCIVPWGWGLSCVLGFGFRPRGCCIEGENGDAVLNSAW